MKKNQRIFTLHLPEVAKIARKSPRTIRRWCQLGFVKGAICTKGGHWRVRVFFTEKDEGIVRDRLRPSGGNHIDEVLGRIYEKVWDAVRPPVGFERGKPTHKPTKKELIEARAMLASWWSHAYYGKPAQVATKAKAEEIFAAFEWAASQDVGASLAPMMERVRSDGFLLMSDEVFSIPLHESFKTAFAASGRDWMGTAFYGAALNLLNSGKPCSVDAVCRIIGVSRATAYRKGVTRMVTLARREKMGVHAEASAPAGSSAIKRRR